MTEPFLGHAILALFAAQRLVEVGIEAQHVRRLVARGGIVVPRSGTFGMIAFHVVWFAAVAAERVLLDARMPSIGVVVPVAAALAVAEAVRVWIHATLRGRWTIRVVVVPGERPVAAGPYRFLRHPNYVVVVAEVLLVPLLLGAWRTAMVGSVLHVPILLHRIRREEQAWREIGGEALGPVRG